jgi:hypothetical protein
MADERADWRQLQLRELLTWTHLFRGFQIALDVKKIVLGAAGAVMTALGSWLIVWLLLAPASTPDATDSGASDLEPAGQLADSAAVRRFDAMAREAMRLPWQAGTPPARGWPDVYRSPLRTDGYLEGGGVPIPKAALLVLEPIRQLVHPVDLLLHAPGGRWWAAALLLLWTLVVWALIGGAITRIAAVQVTRDGQLSAMDALRFVARRYVHYFGAPLLPLIGVVVLGVLCAAAGAIARVFVLDIVVGLFWVLVLLAGFVMAVAVVGLVIGWPLMYSAISVEATEAIDAVSRSYSYVIFGRPWHYFWYALVAVVYGGILTTFVVAVGSYTVDLSKAAVSWGGVWGGESAIHALYHYVPTAGGWREAFSDPQSEPRSTGIIAALFVALWTHGLFLGLVGFAYSYFWSASTIIYLLLRRAVDETEFEEVYLEEDDEEPFPTIAPTAESAPATPSGPSLPVVEPPATP